MISMLLACLASHATAAGTLLDETKLKTIIESGLAPQTWIAPDWSHYNWPVGTDKWISSEANLEVQGDETGSIAEIIGKVNYADAGSIYFGKNDLFNDFDTPQKLTTSAYSKSISNSVTTTTAQGWKIGSKVTVKGGIEIPFISKGEVAVEVSGEYNSSSTDSKTTSVTETYSIPAQTIELKPHERAIVSVYLVQAKATGKYRSYQYIDGLATVPFRSFSNGKVSYWNSQNTVYNYLKYSSILPKDLIDITDEQIKKIKVFSEGTFTANAGVEFKVIVEHVDQLTGNVNKSETRTLQIQQPSPLTKNKNAGSGIIFW